MTQLPHFDADGHVRMVDVGEKPITSRIAVASGEIRLLPSTQKRILDRSIEKGDVLELARVAGVMASKRTADLIPLCHPVRIDSVEIHFDTQTEGKLTVTGVLKASDRTGVEMEALTAVSVACLTVYDMCKSIDRGMVIGPIQLEEKSGGKSGHYQRTE